MPEAVLLDVVAGPQHQRRVDLLVVAQERGQLALGRIGARGAHAGLEGSEVVDARSRLGGGHPVARVTQPGRSDGLDVDGAQQQRLLELRRAGQHAPAVVDDERVAVEDELVLAADLGAERHGAEVVLGALGDHPLARDALPGLVGRRRDVDDQPRARQRLVALRRTRDPDVLADRQPDGDAVDVDHRSVAPALEVAVLVEDAVVGQVVLAVDAADLAVGEHGGAVVDVVRPLREADDGDDPLRLLGDALERLADVREDVLAQQQVLGRVADDRQLGEQHELRAGLARLHEALTDHGLVPADVADDGVDLRESDAHGQEASPLSGVWADVRLWRSLMGQGWRSVSAARARSNIAPSKSVTRSPRSGIAS